MKIKSLEAYSSQFYNPESKEPETLISSEMFWDYLRARARTAGFKIRKEFGEGFITEENIELDVNALLMQGGD